MRGRRGVSGATRPPARAGLTLVEVLAAMAIFALVMVNIHVVTKTGSAATRSVVLKASLGDEIDLTLDRITLALLGTSEEDVIGPPLAPAHSDYVHYTKTLGEEDGMPVVSDPESIRWIASGLDLGRVLWCENPGTRQEREVTWSRSVPVTYLEEVAGNGVDDNGNGLLDERGLAFTKNDKMIEVMLTVEQFDDEGRAEQAKRRHVVAYRN